MALTPEETAFWALAYKLHTGDRSLPCTFIGRAIARGTERASVQAIIALYALHEPPFLITKPEIGEDVQSGSCVAFQRAEIAGVLYGLREQLDNPVAFPFGPC